MTTNRQSCWSCGYDTSSLPTNRCPECGSEIRDTPRRARVQNELAIFTAIMATLLCTAAAFGILLQAATPGGTQAYLIDTALASVPAFAMGGLVLWLMFATPQTVSPRRVLIWTTLACVAAVLASGCVWLLVFLTR